MKTQNVLIVSPVCPFPEDTNGTSVIVHNIAKTLALNNNVTVVYHEENNEAGLSSYELSYDLTCMAFKKRYSNILFRIFIPRNSHWTIGKHLSFSDGANEVFYDLVIVFRLDMGFFLNDLVDDIKYNKIIFYPIDLLSNLYRSLRRVERDYIKRLYYYYQEILLRYWEARFLKIADLNVFVSSIDSTLAQKLYKNTKNIRGFRNGIEQYKGGYLIQDLSAPYRIGFSGDYSYKPNRDAAHFIINKIAPALAKLGISFEIYLIGRNPDYLMLSSQSSDKVRFYITNEVDCIDEWLEKLDIFICPLFSGAGMKNKILKALSIGLPIISTRHGIEGINELVNGVNYIECDNDDAHSWIVKISYLLDNKSMRSSMSLEGKQIVQQRYSWKSVVEDISNSLVFDK